MLFCIIYAVMYAADRSFDCQVVVNLSSVQFLSVSVNGLLFQYYSRLHQLPKREPLGELKQVFHRLIAFLVVN